MRRIVWVLGVAALIAGCSETHAPKMSMEEMNKKPAPAPELQKLSPFIGSWSGTAEIVKPTAEEMKKMMPPGSPAPQMHFNGAETYTWILGGQFLKVEGWHDRGDGQREQFEGVMGWDAEEKKFWSGMISDWGMHGHGHMTVDADGRTFRFEGEEMGAHGEEMKGKGTVRLSDNNTMEWTYQMTGPMGHMEMKGTMKRTM